MPGVLKTSDCGFCVLRVIAMFNVGLGGLGLVGLGALCFLILYYGGQVATELRIESPLAHFLELVRVDMCFSVPLLSDTCVLFSNEAEAVLLVMLCVRSLRISHNTQWHTGGDKLRKYAV